MKKVLPTTNDYLKLFLEEVPLLDVRAPVEFEKGAFPNAENHPILNDKEREVIGTRYKEEGNEEAIALGAKLISGKVKEEKLSSWKKFIETHPNGALYCFRGGMRSRTTQQWIYEAFGIKYPLIEGGYKAMRTFLMEALDNCGDWINPIRIGGRTGTGKTQLLLQLNNVIDLEGLAHHRGSSFGYYSGAQPTQINFENNLAIELLKHQAKGNPPMLLEDEGNHIGRVHIPNKTYKAFRSGPLIVLETPIEERIELTFQEYIIQSLKEYQEEHGEEGFTQWKGAVENQFSRIKNRLGDERFRQMKTELGAAMKAHEETGNTDLYKPWIGKLLTNYYDPMYDYHIAKSDNEVVFQGSAKEIKEYLEKHK